MVNVIRCTVNGYMPGAIGRHDEGRMISTIAGNSRIAESFWEAHSLPKTKEIANIIERSRRQERLRDDIDPGLIANFLVGFIMYRLLKQGIDLILEGMRRND